MNTPTDPRTLAVMGLGLLALLAACGGSSEAVEEEAPRDPLTPIADHHTHIQSHAGAELLVQISEAVGQEVAEDSRHAITAADLIAVMDSAGVEKALVLSVGYFFGFPDVPMDGAEEGMRAENDYVAEQVAAYPDRLVGLCSVNPLDDYAVAEVRRCAADNRLRGLKLHFANSDVDLRDADHVSRVATVFRTAGEEGLPILVHMRTRAPDYGARDVRVFIDDVLSQAPGLPVQLAHMAGWGGYDAATDEALGAFIEAFASGALEPSVYTFDLAAVAIPPERAEPDTARVKEVAEANALLTQRIRQVGLDRVVFATDWSALPMGAYAESLQQTLSLDDAELADIMDNVGAMLR